jgi:hypothetical protein
MPDDHQQFARNGYNAFALANACGQTLEDLAQPCAFPSP